MRNLWPWRNRRWRRQLDAYVDRRMTPIERELFAERLEESEELRATLEQTIALKRDLRNMPGHEAPRSFAITPMMLEARPPEAPGTPRAAVVTMRSAQALAIAAVSAFAITVGLHVSGVGESGSSFDEVPASTAQEEAFTTEAAGAGIDSAEGNEVPSAGSTNGSAGEAEDGADGMAQDANGAADEADDSSGAQSDSVAESAEEERASDGAQPLANHDSQQIDSTDTDSPNYLPFYAGLGVVIVAAVGVWLIARRLAYREPA